jgi:flagellar protein FliO/FliZ
MDAGATLQSLGAVGAVLLLVGACAWLVRRGALVLPGARRRLPVTVETAVPLGERRSLVIVAVEGRRLLLGLTPGQVSLVTELGPAAAKPFDAVLARATDPHAEARP